jgi:protein gp37
MARNSIIQWTDDTLNALLGCFMCSLGCFHCYAIYEIWRMAHNPNFGTSDDNPYVGLVEKCSGKLNWTGRIRFLPERLYAVLREKQSRLFFVNSLSDLFYERLPDEIILEHFRIFGMAYWHQFQALTKRSERLVQLSTQIHWPPNVWMGVSVERVESLYRITHLGNIGAVIKFVSFEPWLSAAQPLRELRPNLRDVLKQAGIDWAIIGGESSKDKTSARYMDFNDVNYLIEECRAAGLKIFLKQLGTRWAVASGTFGKKGADGKRQKEANAGGAPKLWPSEYRDPTLRQHPVVEWQPWTRPPKGTVYPTAAPGEWKNGRRQRWRAPGIRSTQDLCRSLAEGESAPAVCVLAGRPCWAARS